MDTTQMSMREVMLYAAALNAGIGLVLGLVPLIIGFAKGQRRYGIMGLLASTIGGALLGIILSIPSVIVFTWLILGRSKRAATPTDPGA